MCRRFSVSSDCSYPVELVYMLPCKQLPHYHNILELDENGNPLATISRKRANWYLQRGLAIEVDPPPAGYPRCVRLKFSPKGRPSSNYPFQVRQDRCVVCGTKGELTLHHIIPRVISRSFPAQDKNHRSAWCVLLCMEHHLQAEKIIRPYLSGSQLWREAQPSFITFGNRSIAALLHLHRSGKLSKLSASHPDRIRHLCQQAGLSRLPRTSPEWEALECSKVQQVPSGGRDIASDFLIAHGGIGEVKKLFRRLFLQLKPAFLPRGSLTELCRSIP